MTGHAALARANFETGCNCAQAVLCAYPELLPRETAMKLGASLGGGIGRLREVCGAVSTMVLLAGLLCMVMSALFRQATEMKVENDLTI